MKITPTIQTAIYGWSLRQQNAPSAAEIMFIATPVGALYGNFRPDLGRISYWYFHAETGIDAAANRCGTRTDYYTESYRSIEVVRPLVSAQVDSTLLLECTSSFAKDHVGWQYLEQEAVPLIRLLLNEWEKVSHPTPQS